MSMFIDATGAQHQVPIDVTMYRAAAENGCTLRQHINSMYATANVEKYGTAFEQICASEGIRLRNDPRTGQRASTVAQMIEGNGPGMTFNAAVQKDGAQFPTSRILFPAATMALVEDRLQVNLSATANVFNSLVAYEESVNGERVEQPVLNYSNTALNANQGIAQLALPASMISITASDVSYKLPVYSQGIEVSDQAARNTTIDLVALALARTFALQANTRAQGYMLQLLNGDVDNNDQSLSTLGFATTTTALDSAATGGVITQLAWMKWLTQNPEKRQIDTLVTDFATAMKIEGRTGKPIVTTDNPTSPRIDTLMTVLNPTWAPNIRVFLVTAGSNWPANTIMGIDSRFAIRRIRSLTASFQSTEAFVTKRSTVSRYDFGELVNRMFPEAYAVLTVL